MSHLILDQGDTPISRRLRRRRPQIALGIAVVEAILVVGGVLPWWAVVGAAALAVAVYVVLGRAHGSSTVRGISWVAAVSQLIVVLVPVGLVLAGFFALTILVVVALVALVALLLDRR